MKKNLLFKSIALAMLLLVPFIGNAQRLLTENFGNYTTGYLIGQSNWEKAFSNTAAPIQITEVSLSYPGYQETASGKAVELTNTSLGEDAKKTFSETPIANIYYSALVQFKESAIEAGKETYFISTFKAGKTTEFAKVYVKQGSDANKVILGISRNSDSSSGIAYSTTELNTNETHLIVVKYESITGTTNDKVSLFINTTQESTPAATYSGSTGSDIDSFDEGTDGHGAIQLRQGGTSTKQAANVLVDAIRVSTTWKGLFDSEEPDPTPILSTDQSYIMVQEAGDYNVYLGREYPFTVNIKGQNLKGDISISISETSKGQVTSSVTSISKADAESENGVDVPFLLKPNTLDWDYIGETLTFSSEGAAPIELPVYWQSADLINVTDIADFRNKFSELSEDESFVTSFLIQGKVLVSHAYEDEDGTKIIYVQDATGGLRIEGAYGSITTDYQIGDELTNLHIFGVNAFGVYGTPTKDFGAPLSQGNAVEPVTITLAELKAQGARYEGCLVKVENVTITPSATGNFGDEGTTPIYLKQAEGDNSTLRILPGADFIGKPIPESARSITGISTSSAGTVIAPRNLADIDADFEGGGDPEEPGNEVTVGDNLLTDPSLESGVEKNFLGNITYTWEDWDELTQAVIENEIVIDGEMAARVQSKGNANMSQSVSYLYHTFTPGTAYRLIINYHVIKSQGDNDVQLNCAWTSSMSSVEDPNADVLTPSFTGALNTWEKKQIRTVVPTGERINFQFALSVASGAEVIFDDFGFYKLETIATGIGTTEENILSAWCENGVLHIESNRTESIDVYNLHGMLVNRTTLVPGVNTLDLSAGAYLVKAGTETMKVLVK